MFHRPSITVGHPTVGWLKPTQPLRIVFHNLDVLFKSQVSFTVGIVLDGGITYQNIEKIPRGCITLGHPNATTGH